MIQNCFVILVTYFVHKLTLSNENRIVIKLKIQLFSKKVCTQIKPISGISNLKSL